MPNICDFDAKIRGPKTKVLKLAEWLASNYNYDNKYPNCYIEKGGIKIPTEHHIGFRVFETNYSPEDIQDFADADEVTLYAFGNCAWSVSCCMLDTSSTDYLNAFKNEKRPYAISLTKACKELGTEIEIYSQEPGCCFSEHIYVNKEGELILNDCVEYTDTYIGEYETYQDYKNEYPDSNLFTEEEFNTAKSNCDDFIAKCDYFDENNEFVFEFI